MLILPETIILSPLLCFSKKRLFEEVADYASCILKKNAQELINSLNEREKSGTTVFFDGIAFPHAMLTDIDKSIGVLSILDTPITFNSIDADQLDVDISYTFFFSQNEKYDKIEKLLMDFSSLLANNDLLNSLRLCRSEKQKISSILNKIDLSLSKNINQN